MSPDLLMETTPMTTLMGHLGTETLSRRLATTASTLWRAVRVVALAVTVTVGGMGVGAYLIAPLVSGDARQTVAVAPAKAPASAATARAASVIDLSDLLSAAGAGLARGSRGLVMVLSAGRPARALVVPGMLLVVAAGAAATLVVLRRRDAELMAAPTRAVGGGTMGVTLGVTARAAAYPAPKLVKATGTTPSRTASRSASKQGNRRVKAISTLAAAGSSTPDIAKQTGLSIDAVQLMLSITADDRQLQPPAA